MRAQAEALPEGVERTELMKKADQLWSAYLMAHSLIAPSAEKH
jgi:hypothetical protein